MKALSEMSEKTYEQLKNLKDQGNNDRFLEVQVPCSAQSTYVEDAKS